jgi:hypothetical protein
MTSPLVTSCLSARSYNIKAEQSLGKCLNLLTNTRRTILYPRKMTGEFIMSITISSRSTLCSLLLLALVALVPQSALAQSAPETAKTKGGALTLLNCTARAVNVKAYNADDAKMLVPTQTSAVASGLTMEFGCATQYCKLAFTLSRPLVATPQASYAILRNSTVTPTDAQTIAKGCK